MLYVSTCISVILLLCVFLFLVFSVCLVLPDLANKKLTLQDQEEAKNTQDMYIVHDINDE